MTVTKSYQVDYHVIQVIYFESPHVPSGPEFAQLWASTRIFGDRQVVGAFWHSGAAIPSKLPRFTIGSLEHLAPLLAKGTEPIYGGGTVAQRKVARDSTLDADFYFALSDASRWQAAETMPSLLMSISGQWFENTGVETVLEMLKENAVVLDRHAPPYGLVDLARSDDGFAGMAYVSTWMQRLPLHRWVEQGNWVYGASKRGDRVRSIYWGNYLGPKILTRLGGRDNFIRRYREQARMKDGTPSAHIWEFTNGVFVSLCLNPLGCRPGMPLDYSAVFNLQWLHKELGGKGALCGWHTDHADHKASYDPETSTVRVNTVNEQPQSAFQSLSDLNDAEREWLAECVSHARDLVKKYLSTNANRPLDPATLDRAYGGWLTQWQGGNASEAANAVVNSVGSAFGQWLVDVLGMEWVVVAAAKDSDMAVCYGPPAARVLVFPTHAVAKRLETRETNFMQELFEVIRTRVDAVKVAGTRSEHGG
jgi:hypothetical protein